MANFSIINDVIVKSSYKQIRTLNDVIYNV